MRPLDEAWGEPPSPELVQATAQALEEALAGVTGLPEAGEEADELEWEEEAEG